MRARQMLSIENKEELEIEFWRTSRVEGPDCDTVINVVNKVSDARILLDACEAHAALFGHASDILELGGGQCWASCLIKRLYPRARVVGTDISPAAVASAGKWERLWQAKLDDVAACRSYRTPFPSQSFDLIFAFAAAHHFVRHGATLREIARLLRPGGAALYLHEPGCRGWIYRLAHWRVNAKRPDVPEDVLRYRRLEKLAGEAGLQARTVFAPRLVNRSPPGTLYFSLLQRAPFLQNVLPCTVDIVFKKV